MPIQRQIFFSGHVQGVGFRYHTQRLAAAWPVTGFVRNLDDGRVELVVEGPSDAVEQLLGELRSHFAGHIRSETVDERPATGQHEGFAIRR